MRTNHSLPQAPLFVCTRGQGRGEIMSTRALVAQRQGLVPRADRRSIPREKRPQLLAKLGPRRPEILAGGKERAVVGRQLPPAMRTLLEQEIPRTQSTLVSPQFFRITRITLAPEEIEEAPAFGRRAANQLDVLVAKKGNEPHPEVSIGLPLRHIVEFELASFGRGIMAGQITVAAAPQQRKAGSPAPHRLGQRSGPRGLQTKQHANRFEQRGLPAGIGRAEQIQARGRMEFRPREASEIVQNKRIEHGKVFGIQCSVIQPEKQTHRRGLAGVGAGASVLLAENRKRNH